MELRGKRVLIIGKGLSGNSSAKLVETLGGKAYFYDDLDFTLGDYPQLSYSEVIRYSKFLDFAVVSPSITPDHPLVKKLKEKGISVVSEPDLGCMFSKCKIIAVTGTNGKTTSVEMISKMLMATGIKAPAVGNIGLPLSSVSLALQKDDVAVVEISSFQLEQSSCFKADFSGITNISIDHIERHKTQENYTSAKLKLFDLTSKIKVAEEGVFYQDKSNALFSYGKKIQGVYCQDGEIFYCKGEETLSIMKESDLGVKGVHNVKNALFALSLCIAYKGEYDIRFKEALQTFTSSKFRIQYEGEYKGRKVYNDSKGTNISATQVAIDTMEEEVILIMGGYDKGESYINFFKNLPSKVKRIYVCGANGYKIFDGANKTGKSYLLVAVTNPETALKEIFSKQGRECILYSPSTSSYDSFSDYKERGKHFEKILSAFQGD